MVILDHLWVSNFKIWLFLLTLWFLHTQSKDCLFRWLLRSVKEKKKDSKKNCVGMSRQNKCSQQRLLHDLGLTNLPLWSIHRHGKEKLKHSHFKICKGPFIGFDRLIIGFFLSPWYLVHGFQVFWLLSLMTRPQLFKCLSLLAWVFQLLNSIHTACVTMNMPRTWLFSGKCASIIYSLPLFSRAHHPEASSF